MINCNNIVYTVYYNFMIKTTCIFNILGFARLYLMVGHNSKPFPWQPNSFFNASGNFTNVTMSKGTDLQLFGLRLIIVAERLNNY